MGYGLRVGDKAVAPRPGIPIPRDKILELIPHFRGNLSRIADALGTTRKCIRTRCEKDQELKDALEDARERKIDRLEECVWTRAEETLDNQLVMFLLKTQARHRGYDTHDTSIAKDLAQAAFDFVLDRSKHPVKHKTPTIDV